MPSMATTVFSLTIRTARATTAAGVVDDRAGLSARGERAVGFVGAIGEDFGGDAQIRRARPAFRISEPGRPNRISVLIERRDRARDRAGELRDCAPPC